MARPEGGGNSGLEGRRGDGRADGGRREGRGGERGDVVIAGERGERGERGGVETRRRSR